MSNTIFLIKKSLYFNSLGILFFLILGSSNIYSQTCDCQEYVYVNERDFGSVHKFLVETDGSLTEVNPTGPWYPNGSTTQLPSPHGLGSDLNGFLYIAEDWNDPTADIRRLSCDGTILPESEFQLNAQAFNITSIGNTLLYNQPGGGTGADNNDLDYTSVDGYDICNDADLGSACFTDGNGTEVSGRWGFWKDDNDFLWAYSITNGDHIYRFTIDDIGTGTCIDPYLSGAAGDFFTESRNNVRGITTDPAGNIYLVNAQSFGGPGRVTKLDATGTIVAETPLDSTPGDGGYYGIVGLIYVESCDCLYSANYTTEDDCVTSFSLDLQTITTAVGPVGGDPTNNDGPIGGKAIGKVFECCPVVSSTTITETLCLADVSGEEVFLQDIIACGTNRVICEGSWTETTSNANVSFNDCNLTVIGTAAGGCSQYTLTSGGGANLSCDPFTIVVDVCFEDCTMPCTDPNCFGVSATRND